MAWYRLNKAGDARGLFTEIPSKGYSGWVCYLKEDAFEGQAPNYDCQSKFIATFELNRLQAPDLRNNTSYPGGGWFCDVVHKDQYSIDKAMCRCPLPVEQEEYPSADVFRWSPYWYVSRPSQVFQLGYVANSTDVNWIGLDYVELTSASNLAVTIVSLVAALLLF